MNRRQLLAGVGGSAGVVAGGAGLGYLLEPDCPGPGDGETLSHRARRVGAGRGEGSLQGHPFTGDHGPIVVVSDGNTGALDLEAHPSWARTFIEETDDDRAILLAMQIISTTGDDHRFTGVERREGDVIHTYSCTTDPTPEDVGLELYWLVRVRTAVDPARVRHTHASGDDERTLDVDPRAD